MTECGSARNRWCALTLAALGAGCFTSLAAAQVATSRPLEPVQVEDFMAKPEPRASRASVADRLNDGGKVWHSSLLDSSVIGPVLNDEPVGRGACDGADCPAGDDGGFRAELDPAAPVRVADNFSLQAAGSPSSLCFWGFYGDNTAPTSETFTINILSDVGGVPGAVVFTQNVTTGAGLTRTLTGRTFELGDPPAPVNEFQYQVTLTGAPNLPAGQCHWIEVLHEGTNPQGWFWIITTAGDARIHNITDAFAPYSNFNELQVGFDTAWCFNLARNLDSGCALASADQVCQQDDLDNSCQFSDMTTGGVVSDDLPSPDDPAGLADVVVADDFQVPAGGPQSVSELCWGGFYLGNGTQPDVDAFRIEFYNDANGAPGSIIATLDEGFDFTVTRGWSGNFQGEFFYSTTLAPGAVTLPGGDCYWISIRNGAPNSKWLWLTSIEGNAVAAIDTAPNGVPSGWTAGDREDGLDMFFCLGFDMVPFGGCAFNPNLPGNDQCFAASGTEFTLPINGARRQGSNVGATETTLFDGVEPCGIVPLAPNPDIWYTVANGPVAQDVTVSTNNAGTNIDTVLSVLCSASGVNGDCGSGLFCIAANDDISAANRRSSVTFTAQPNTTYFVRVAGFDGDVGNIDIGATAVAASGDPAVCMECEIDSTGAVMETEACDPFITNTNGGCTTIDQVVTVPSAFYGTFFANIDPFAPRDRDIDAWGMDLPAAADVLITIRNETPVAFFMLDLRNACASPDQEQLFGFVLPASCDGSTQITITLDAGNYWFVILPATIKDGEIDSTDAFTGSMCDTFGEYRVDVEEVAQGQCCLPAGDCIEVSEPICDLNDGVYSGDNTTCAGPTCDATPQCPCEFDGVAGVNVFDLLAYLDLWFAQAAGADVDGVAGVNVFDLLFFLDCWFPASAGNPCP